MAEPQASGTILLVGGGRWARVYLAVLAGLGVPDIRIVSRHGGERLAAAMAQAQTHGATVTRFADIDAALASGPVSAAIIANAARDHVHTSLPLLGQGIPVLLEKPAALTRDEAARLFAAAARPGAVLRPALALIYCDYLANFAAAARDAFGVPEAVEIVWRDGAGETRYGEAKSYDSSIGIAEDVGPHVGVLLSSALGIGSGRITGVSLERGGLGVVLRGSWNDIALRITLDRQGDRRERLVVLKSAGREARLDFSVEPGTITIDGVARNADPQWPRPLSPLAKQAAAFLRHDPEPALQALTTLQAITDFSLAAAELVREAQTYLLESGLTPQDNLTAMRELLAPLLLAAGCWQAGDNDRLDALARDALQRGASRPLADLVRELCAKA